MRDFPYTKDGMKQIFADCPHKGWAKKCVALIEGNVIDPAYHASYIRGYSVVMNGQFTEPEWVSGYLQTYDLNGVQAPDCIRQYIRAEENREKSFIVMHVYGFGWIAYTSTREVLPSGERVTTAKVAVRYVYPYRRKAYALMDWLVDAVQTEERYVIDEHGWPKAVGQDRESYTDDQDRESYT